MEYYDISFCTWDFPSFLACDFSAHIIFLISLMHYITQTGFTSELLLGCLCCSKFCYTLRCTFPFQQMEAPLQHHGGRLEHNETYCGSCYGAQEVCFYPLAQKIRNCITAFCVACTILDLRFLNFISLLFAFGQISVRLPFFKLTFSSVLALVKDEVKSS